MASFFIKMNSPQSCNDSTSLMMCVMAWRRDNLSLTWDHSKPQPSHHPINSQRTKNKTKKKSKSRHFARCKQNWSRSTSCFSFFNTT